MIPKLLEVKVVKDYTLFLRFSDGTTGTADLEHLAGKGVFSKWTDPGFFRSVTIDPESNALAWGQEIDICPDTLYLQIKGISFEDWKKLQLSHATD